MLFEFLTSYNYQIMQTEPNLKTVNSYIEDNHTLNKSIIMRLTNMIVKLETKLKEKQCV